MGAIWHDNKMPSFLGIPPSYSFQDMVVGQFGLSTGLTTLRKPLKY